jgi:hypothetical protein
MQAWQRSIAGQVEFWARLGRSVELMLGGQQVLALSRTAAARPLSEGLESVGSPGGRERLAAVLDSLPFPHFEPHPDRTLSNKTARKWFYGTAGCWLGSDGGSPNHGSTLLSKRIRALMRSPVRAMT